MAVPCPPARSSGAAGVKGASIPGLPADSAAPGNRIKVNDFHQVIGAEVVMAIGDIAYMPQEAFPNGHPQLAQVAMQQAKNLAHNLQRKLKAQAPLPFAYRDWAQWLPLVATVPLLICPDGNSRALLPGWFGSWFTCFKYWVSKIKFSSSSTGCGDTSLMISRCV